MKTKPSAGLPVPDAVVHGLLTVKGAETGKPLANVIAPFTGIDLYGAEAGRYSLLTRLLSADCGAASAEHFDWLSAGLTKDRSANRFRAALPGGKTIRLESIVFMWHLWYTFYITYPALLSRTARSCLHAIHGGH